MSRVYGSKALTFICGPTPLVEPAANGLLELGLKSERIKTETVRFERDVGRQMYATTPT